MTEVIKKSSMAKSQPIPTRKPSVTFLDDCVFIDDHLLSTTENGIKRRISVPGQSGLPTFVKAPGTKKRLSLSIVPSSPKFRLPRRWSNGLVSAGSTPTSPRISTKGISAPISLPSTPTMGSVDDVMFKEVKSEVEMHHATHDPECNMEGFKAGELFASESSSTMGPSNSMDVTTLDTPRSINIADHEDVRVGTVPTSRPILHIAPDYSPVVPIPRQSTTLPLTTSTSSLTFFMKVKRDLSSQRKRLPRISSTEQPRTATHVSPHQMTRSLSTSDTTAPSSYPTLGGRKHRPFVIRASSTGRLANEFDEEGRIICLSSHSERIISANQVNGPYDNYPPLRPGAARSNSTRGAISSPYIGSPVSRTQSLLERLGSPGKEERGVSSKERKGYTVVNS